MPVRRPIPILALSLVTAGALWLGTAAAATSPGATEGPVRPAAPAAGGLDPSFGGDGRVTTNLTAGFDAARAVAIQPDGAIVAAGSAGGSNGRFAVVRYDPDGTLDAAFGNRGRVTTDLTGGADLARGVAVQSDGRILVAGQTGGNHGRFALVRYEPDGTLDTSFGGDGKVTTAFPSKIALPDGAVAVAVQADGRIVAAGFANGNCSCVRFALARYRTNGTLDPTFGDGGTTTTRFRGGADPTAMALAPDGSIVVVGGNVPDVNRFQVARYTPDGVLDTSFGGDGKVTTDMGQGEESATGVAVQNDGAVVVVGYTDQPHEFGETFGPVRFALARYRPDGALDAAFGTGGKVLTSFATGAVPRAVAIQNDGRIVAVGEVGRRGGRFELVRYTRAGALDTTFGGDGRVAVDFTRGEDAAYAVAIQTDQRIVAAGIAGGQGGRFALARSTG
ncbi:MAG: hypothetical protein ACE14W_08980 [Candidatus Velamenicoccus archaeovorus]